MGNSDAPDLRVAKAEEEGSIRLVEEKASDVLLADEANDQPGQGEGEDMAVGTACLRTESHGLLGQGLTGLTSSYGDSV